MPLHPDFRDLVAVFAAHEVDYLTVGGYAVGFHARPRFTRAREPRVKDSWTTTSLCRHI